MKQVTISVTVEADDDASAQRAVANALHNASILANVNVSGRSFSERSDVLAFHQKFGVLMPQEPALLAGEMLDFRTKFLREELQEFVDDTAAGDLCGAGDALVDLVYVAHGTALLMGLPWPLMWNEVQRANMAKVRALSATESKRGTAFDVVKPAGWVAPDHSKFLGRGPWATFDGAEVRQPGPTKLGG